jgi:cobalt-zinc-cadmium efflux system outer membrane protein
MKKIILVLSVTYISLFSSAQKNVSEEEVIALALKNSAQLKASSLQVKQSQQLQKSGANLRNPDVTIESPTGEFMTWGVLQNIEFPSVYARQTQLLSAKTVLAERGKVLTENDIRKLAREIYLQWQYENARIYLLQIQDSFYNELQKTSARNFEAGQIDKLQQLFAEAQFAAVHNQFIAAQNQLAAAQNKFRLLTGLSDSIQPAGLEKQIVNETWLQISDSTSNHPLLSFYEQLQNVERKNLQVERNKVLPGFSFGYLNQGLKTTPAINRLRGGISVPLWFWQYAGNIQAAKTGWLISQQQTQAALFAINTEKQTAISNWQSAEQQLRYFKKTGLKQADDIISAATRFFQNGQTDYINLLRTLGEAYSIKQKNLEALRDYNISIIQLKYLNGQ